MKMYDDQLIVITGGAGFIGSCVIKTLNEKGFTNIVVVDSLGCSDKWMNLVGKRFVEILEKEQLFDWLEGRESEIEAFIHLGACSSTVEKDAGYLLKNNYQYSVELAKYAVTNGQRFIYASSAATYGDGSNGFSDDHSLLDALQPMNMYGYSKHLFDLWLKEQGLLDKVAGLKYFNVFGPNEWHKERMASVVFHALPKAQKEGVIRLFKSSEPDRFRDGEQKRDFIYAKDAARMTAAFLENDATGIFNIGRGVPGTWNELAAAIFKALDAKPKIEYIDMPPDLIGKYQNYSCADMQKSSLALGDAAKTPPLAESIVDYVQNHLIKEQRW